MQQPLSKAKARLIRTLHGRKARTAKRLFFVEGRKMLQEALASGWPISFIVIREGLEFDGGGLPCSLYVAEARDFAEFSTQQSPEGLLTVLEMPEQPMPSKEGPAFLLDGIQDPGNLGTIIRTADWFGITNVICGPGTVDVFNPKVLRSSMGSIFRIRVSYVPDLNAFISGSGCSVLAAGLQGKALDQVIFKGDELILLGNEANGISEAICNNEALDWVTIAGSGSAESLNVAIAAGIFAYAFSAQRS